MTTWLNNAQGTQVLGGGDGPTWINNAPAQQAYAQSYAQPQQSASPVFDYITRMLPTQPQYDYSQQQQAQYNPGPLPARQNVFNFGMNGVTGNGQINVRDNANVMVGLLEAQYQQAQDMWRDGRQQNPWEMASIKSQLDHQRQVAATGQDTSFYAQPTFAPQWDQYNTLVRNLGATGINYDLESTLPPSLRGQNTGEIWKGFQATPIGSSFGDGSGGGDSWGTASFAPSLPAGMREASFTVGNGDRPIISTGAGGVITQYAPNSMGGWSSMGNMNGANATPYNNGDLRSAHDYGSYNTPLLRSGHDDHFAVANINGGGGSPYPSAFEPSDMWNQPAQSYSPGDVVQPDGSIYNPARALDKYDPNSPAYNPPGFVEGGGFLPFGLDDAIPVQMQSTLKNAYDGFDIINEANPTNLLPKNMALNAARDAAIRMMTNRNMWRGDGGFHNIGNVLAQPWANRNIAPTQFGTAMRLFL